MRDIFWNFCGEYHSTRFSKQDYFKWTSLIFSNQIERFCTFLLSHHIGQIILTIFISLLTCLFNLSVSGTANFYCNFYTVRVVDSNIAWRIDFVSYCFVLEKIHTISGYRFENFFMMILFYVGSVDLVLINQKIWLNFFLTCI